MKNAIKLMVFVMTLSFLFSPVLSLEPEERFRIDITFYSNESKVSVNDVSIVESRQISAFSKNANYKLSFEDKNSKPLEEYYQNVGFEVFNETFGGGSGENSYIDDQTRYVLYTEYFEKANNLSIYENNRRLTEINLKKEICGDTPCHEFCRDSVNQSKLNSCQSYERVTGDNQDETGKEKIPNSFDEIKLIIPAALIVMLSLIIYYRKKGNDRINSKF